MSAKSHVESLAHTGSAQLADRKHDADLRPKCTQLDFTASDVDEMRAARANQTQSETTLPKETHDAQSLAAELFDEALREARIETGEVAYLLGISESLVRRMRSKDARERVSFVQMLRLPPTFHIELHRAMNRRFGFGRAALRRLLDAVGDLVVAEGI